MSRKYKFRNPEGLYFITFSVVRWIDVFTRNIYREILLDSFKYCQQNKGLQIHAFVIMTNHVHMIVSAADGFYLENIMRDLKKFTSMEIIKAIQNSPSESRRDWLIKAFKEEGLKNSNNTLYQFWRQDNHPIELTDNKMMDQKLEYIHYNPVKQGFVAKPEDYPWSSISNYIFGTGLIKLKLLNNYGCKIGPSHASTISLQEDLDQCVIQVLQSLLPVLKTWTRFLTKCFIGLIKSLIIQPIIK